MSVNFGSSGTLNATETQLGPPETLSVGITGSGTVTSSPSGVSCPGVCSSTFTFGTTVTLSASPAAGYTFGGWSGACSGTGICIVTMNAAVGVNATFNAVPESLSVSVSGGTGSGTVISSPAGISCPGVCGTSFSHGTNVFLTASPSSGFGFSGWSGACSGNSTTCSLTMNAAKSVTATFAPLQTLGVSVNGNGTVTSSPSGIFCPSTCSASFVQGASVTLSPSAAVGFKFTGWSGACSGTGSCVVVMNTGASVTATFTAQPAQTLTLSVTGNGTVTSSPSGISCPGTCSTTFAYGTTVNLSDLPATIMDYFVGWTGACSGTGACTITMTSAATVNATFAPVPTGQIITLAGNGIAGFSGDGGAATSAELHSPGGVAVDTAGNIYVADPGNNRIRKITASTGVISTVAGNGTAGFSGDGGAATSAELNTPVGVAVDTGGNIYIADEFNNRIRKVTLTTGIISTVAGNGTPGFSGDGGPATSASVKLPRGVSVDASGDIYIADTNHSRIRKVTVSTGIINTVAGSGLQGYAGDGGAATSAGLCSPSGVVVDAAGNFYIADTCNNRIRKVTASTGIISTVAGNGTAGYSGDAGAATSAELSGPLGVAVDSAGNIYIADRTNNRVREVAVSTGIISTVAGNGIAGYSGDGGMAASAELNSPGGVTVDSAGNIYIADTTNNRARAIGH